MGGGVVDDVGGVGGNVGDNVGGIGSGSVLFISLISGWVTSFFVSWLLNGNTVS